MGRRGRETPDKTDAYKRALAVLKRGGSLAEAAKAAGVGRDTLWEWRKKNADFAARAEEAMGIGIDRLEDVLQVCAQKALTNPAYQKALIFLLTNRRPDKWKLHRNANQTPEFKVRFPDAPPEQRAAAEARRAKCLELAGQAAQQAGFSAGLGGLAEFLLVAGLGMREARTE